MFFRCCSTCFSMLQYTFFVVAVDIFHCCIRFFRCCSRYFFDVAVDIFRCCSRYFSMLQYMFINVALHIFSMLQLGKGVRWGRGDRSALEGGAVVGGEANGWGWGWGMRMPMEMGMRCRGARCGRVGRARGHPDGSRLGCGRW